MKKILSFVLTAAMVMSLSVTGFAADTGFVSSPSNNKAPVISGFEFEGEGSEGGYDGTLVVTAYADRENLENVTEEEIKQAYNTIRQNPNLANLCDTLEKTAEIHNTSVESLAVRDLFDISYIPGSDGKTPSSYKIKLESDSYKNFVALLHYKDNNWEIVENAEILTDEETQEEYLSFSVDSLSPFAIVVNTAAPVTAEPEQGFNWWWILLALAGGGTGTYAYSKNKKGKIETK